MFVRWLIAPKREIMRCLNFDLIAFSGTAEKQIAAIKLPVVFSAAGSKMSLGFGSKNQAPWAVLLVLAINDQSSTKSAPWSLRSYEFKPFVLRGLECHGVKGQDY